jgi:glycosyltransferase involved in cell wall biosynthesis
MAHKVAIVVQRYGMDVLGGAESMAADIAACLSKAYDVEVLTTCALAYDTWNNYFPEGESVESGVKIRRFAVDSPRHFLFKPVDLMLRHVPHTPWIEKAWMRMQGPYSSRLIRYVSSNEGIYDVFVFVTYLYCTTYYCLPMVKDKAVLVPTAHDEPPIYFEIFRDVFGGARKLVYMTEEEKTFTDRLFGLSLDRSVVAGAWVREGYGDAAAFRARYGVSGDFILYAGRLDVSKGVPTLLKYFEEYLRESGRDLKLVICGSGPMRIPDGEHIVKLGFIPDAEKYGAMAAALATVIPSRFESLSYSLLESMFSGTPALVNGQCSVLRGHCERSGGCLCYDSYESFRSALDRILDEPSLRERMGKAGSRYARENYSKEAVGKKYITCIDGLINDRKRSS